VFLNAWRNWRARAHLVNSLSPLSGLSRIEFQREIRFPEYRDNGRTRLLPYEGLADLWDDYGSGNWNYPAYLKGLVAAGRGSLGSVLDLACGTGRLACHLAQSFPEVVGLDASEAMLAQARSRAAGHPTVQFVQGDFRAFRLGKTFDMAVCEANSMNYVTSVEELAAVLRAVALHLEPGGRFVFDTTTAAGMRQSSGVYVHAESAAGRFVIHYRYNRRTRRQRALVHVPAGTELHKRIAIDPADVAAAAQGSELEVEEYFTSALLPGRWHTGSYCFFVLKRRMG
jgi:SAM-dependent methyltransferase